MAYRSSSTKSTDGTSTISVGVPAGVAANDIIIIIASKDGAANATGAVPSGFTAFFTNTSCTVDGQKVTAGWKRASGADSGSYTFGAPGNAATDWICQAFAFSGRDTTNAPVASTANVQNTGQSSPVTDNANGVTAVAGDDLLWLSAPDATVSGGVTGHTPPTSYTERQDATSAFSSASGATQDNVSAGATGTVAGSFTLSSGTAGYVTVLIRIPVAAGGGLTVGEMEASQEPTHFYNLPSLTGWAGQHEVFASDQHDVFRPILPVSTLAEIWYNEHLDHPNVQGPQHQMQDVDMERWILQILLPKLPPWDNDADQQEAQDSYRGIGTDQGLDWTQFIVLPGFNPATSRVDIDEFAHQYPSPGWAAVYAEYEAWTQQVLIPTVAWDNDADHQKPQDDYTAKGADSGLDWTEFIVLQVLPFNPATSFVDSDADYQSPQAGYSGIGSDQGQDWVQYILIPAPAWDGDLDLPNVNPTLAQGPYFFNDETVGVPIIFISVNGGQVSTLYIPLHQLSALHGLSQL